MSIYQNQVSTAAPAEELLDFNFSALRGNYEIEDPDPLEWTELGTLTPNGELVDDAIKRHKASSITNFLDSMGAVYPGGYALALFHGDSNSGLPDTAKFGDIDVIHRDTSKTKSLVDSVKFHFNILNEHETDRAHTLWVEGDNGEEVMLQFVTSWTASVDTILSRFDFNNCKICLDPQNGFYHYADLPDLLAAEILELGPDWDEYTPPNSLSLSIPRALKYCERWGWELDRYSLRRLTSLWMSISEDNRWKPADEVDSGHGVIVQGGSVNAENLGTILRKLYETHNIEPPKEITLVPPTTENLMPA